MFSTPVLLLLFNRPDKTAKLLAEIRKLQPQKLFIAADGARKDHAGDAKNCTLTRALLSTIDWDCELHTLLQDENLGCGLGPATGITWFFDHVDQGIILEDDCLPNTSFFLFCTSLLDKYASDPRVMMVCGTSYQPRQLTAASYYFSRYHHVWGWATWKRSWAHYHFDLSGESETERTSVLKKTFKINREIRFWQHNLNIIIRGLDAWDYQWMYWIWKNDGLCIIPWKNMVSNAGFGEDATHTLDGRSAQSMMPRHQLAEIKHPASLQIHEQADRYERFNILIEPAITFYKKRIQHRVKQLFKK